MVKFSRAMMLLGAILFAAAAVYVWTKSSPGLAIALAVIAVLDLLFFIFYKPATVANFQPPKGKE